MLTVQERIQQLLWNQRLILVPFDMEAPKGLSYFIVKDLTINDRNYYLFIREFEKDLAQKGGVQDENELLNEAKKSGFWTKKDDVVLRDGHAEIKRLEDEIKTLKIITRKKSLQKNIDSIKQLLFDTEIKKQSLYLQSAEYYAHEVATHDLIRKVVFDKNNNSFWPNDESFITFKRAYPELLTFMAQSVLSEGILDITTIRQIVRSPEWRLLWTLQRENLGVMFNRPICDFNINHRLVIYWSRIYDSAFEAIEPPDSDIVNNDDKFDIWLLNRDKSKSKISAADNHQESLHVLDGEYVEVCNCGMKEFNQGKGLGQQMPHANTCMYGVFRKYSPQEREELSRQIYDKNSGAVRAIQEKEQRIIADQGMVDETDLRNRKTRLVMGMPEKIVKGS